jgi:hypothetical protein
MARLCNCYLRYVNEVYTPISLSRFRLRAGNSVARRAVQILTLGYEPT